MAFGKFDQNKSSGALAEINMVPLIDVMLVLLVVFMITAPMMSHGVKLQLPTVSSSPVEDTPQTITLSVDAQGVYYWNDKVVDKAQLENEMKLAVQLPVMPVIKLRVDEVVPYKEVAEIMGASSRAGLSNLQFVTTPNPVVQANP
ncbi:biopolymer transporter ExbD [Leeia sp. TBRC 13508]|uniref:Biopolymer transporter ExbD n=1 Tax=Leeia speluncae TaxID=2884804 RepID=A0ABS8D6A7_9NEIS|nr:biopolymer transporter ExbD [Leeia speluncae]MCB6183712.1 biopolymer transporter ExbD [Leeia speluncae]